MVGLEVSSKKPGKWYLGKKRKMQAKALSSKRVRSVSQIEKKKGPILLKISGQGGQWYKM